MRTIGLCLIVLAGCVDELQGSNIEFDFKSNTPTQAVVDTAAASPGQFPRDIHFSLYALSSSDTTGYMFKIQDFEIHKIVDLTSPCFIDVGEHVPHPGLHVSQYLDVIKQDTGISDPLNPPADASQDNKIEAATAYQRDKNVHLLYDDSTGIKALSDASTAVYPAIASACGATDGIPRPASARTETDFYQSAAAGSGLNLSFRVTGGRPAAGRINEWLSPAFSSLCRTTWRSISARRTPSCTCAGAAWC